MQAWLCDWGQSVRNPPSPSPICVASAGSYIVLRFNVDVVWIYRPQTAKIIALVDANQIVDLLPTWSVSHFLAFFAARVSQENHSTKSVSVCWWQRHLSI
jgi:hypothetical protein